jgi:hypothetical protein
MITTKLEGSYIIINHQKYQFDWPKRAIMALRNKITGGGSIKIRKTTRSCSFE